MKKQLVASLAAAMVLGVAGTSFAAANPFVDVPAKHWAYASVMTLSQAGIVDGYGDGTFKGDKMISRYEMAQIVAKAMARSDKADAKQKAIIDQLSVEFASELEGLNVRVSKLEKNASNVKLTGVARLRYDDKNFTPNLAPNSANESNLTLRTRIMVAGNINSDWTYNGRFENIQDLRTQGGDTETKFNIANVRGPIAGIDTTIGRQEYMPNYGLLLDTSMDGVKLSFGNLVKTNVYAGRNTKEGNLANTQDIAGADFKYATSKATNVVAGAYQLDDSTTSVNDKTTAYEIGFDSKIGTDLVLKSAYANVDKDGVTGDDTAYFAGVAYKVADAKKVGSYSLFANYRNIEKNAQLVPTFDAAVVAKANGGKGYEVGFQYVPTTNAVARVKYVDLKSSPASAIEKLKFVQAQVEFFF